MANVKITDLTAYTNPDSTDVLPIVDVGADVTKKISIADLLENAGSGTADAPGIAFDGDNNTGIYRPGPDQLAISTNGAQALYIDSDGDILVADGNRMEIDEIRARDGAGLKLYDDAGAGIFIQDGGNVGLGTSSPSSPNSRNRFLHIAATSGYETPSIHLEGGASYTNPSWEVGLSSEGVASRLFFANGTNTRLAISSAGNVGIGTTSPAATLHSRSDNAGSSSTPLLIQNRSVSANTAVGISFAPNISDITDRSAIIYGVNSSGGSGNATDLTFHTNANGGSPSEKARIDSSGRLLVGTASARTVEYLPGSAGIPKLQVEGDDGYSSQILITDTRLDGRNPSLAFAKTKNGAIVASDDVLGSLSFFGDDGTDTRSWGGRITCEVDGTPGADDMPGRLVFSVTADGASSPTEALRISNDRSITVSDGGDVVLGTTTGTKIGTATSQKIGFYNATPVVQPTAVADITTTATSGSLPTPDGSVTIADAATPTVTELLEYCVELEAKLEAALGHLRTLGLIAT